jgi:menaquinone-dependent protoporphyrinogen oxidase
MNDKILVAYATWVGSTGEVAQAIGQTLSDDGAAVDVLAAQDVGDVSPYRAVVLGTAIRAGQVHPDVLTFVEARQEALSRVPVAYFVVCLTMSQDTEENRCTVDAYLNVVRERAPQIKPVDVGLFAGALDYGKLPPPMKAALEARKVPEGDFRAWEAIRAWASHVHPALLGT